MTVAVKQDRKGSRPPTDADFDSDSPLAAVAEAAADHRR